MLEVIQNRVGLLKETAGDLVAGIITSNLICQAYDNCSTCEYPPVAQTTLSQLGYDLANGSQSNISMLWFINRNHWTASNVDQTATIHYADPKGKAAPSWLTAALEWWLSKHREDITAWEWAPLACSHQPNHDNHSCGILSVNVVAHHHLPNEYPLIDPEHTSIARMELGIQVINHHVKMVCKLVFRISVCCLHMEFKGILRTNL